MFRFWMTVLLLVTITACFAGNTGKLAGKIKDVDGKGLGYVNISILDHDKRITGTQSKDNGTYLMINIPPGVYDVKYSLMGFEIITVTGVRINQDQTTTQNVTLPKKGVVMQSYRVTAEKEKISKDPSGKRDISMKTMGESSVTDVEGIVALQSGANMIGGELHVRGGRANEVNYTVDGQSVSDPVPGGNAKYNKDGQHVTDKGDNFKPPMTPKPVMDEPEIDPYSGYPVGSRADREFHAFYDCRYIHHYMPPPPPPYIPYNTEDYAKVYENDYKYSGSEPLSTFSIDVDTACYSNIRRMIESNQLPDPGYVRIEELLNYFKYEYPQPKDEHPFAVYTEVGKCPWDRNHKLLHIGIQSKDIDMNEAPAANLVFLLDVSGSMADPNKLELVKESMKLLVNQLRPEDRVAIVTYSSTTNLALNSTSGRYKTAILNAINALYAGGSTAGGAGIERAYQTASDNFIKGGNNRIILCTDGDFNTGDYSNFDMEKLVVRNRDDGIFLTVLGFGVGNIKDSKMELIADKGNGNYAYIDNLLEAHRVLVQEMGGTLLTVGKDVKLQLEFNPNEVRAYRLIGYENRKLNNEDFNNDRKDAGDMGAGNTVTALYEIVPAGSDESIRGIDPLKYQKPDLTDIAVKNNELLTIKLRYKKPQADESTLMTRIVMNDTVPDNQLTENFRFASAVAGYGLLLKNSQYKGNMNWDMVTDLANGSIGKDPDGYRRGFVTLAEQARDLQHGNHHYYEDNDYRK